MPSRATLLTGHHQHGIESMRMEGEYPGSAYDPDKCPFWPSVFRKSGYTTTHIGKWHTGFDDGFGRDWDHQIIWKYRGQITTLNKQMSLDLHITKIEKTEGRITLVADGNLSKDGLRIYEVTNLIFCVEENG